MKNFIKSRDIYLTLKVVLLVFSFLLTSLAPVFAYEGLAPVEAPVLVTDQGKLEGINNAIRR